MRTYTTTCDICSRLIEPSDVRVITVAGQDLQVDPACLKASQSFFRDSQSWGPLREIAAKEIENEVALASANLAEVTP